MKAVLVSKRDERGIVRSCCGVDLAVMRSAPLGHPIRIEGDAVDHNPIRGELVHEGERFTFEIIEGFSNLVVA